jgi:ABC-type glycerol-3-phosphate transport system substrate-binding protein
MIDESFTRETGIGVNLSLVDINTLLPATVSGQGPDVAIQIGVQPPVGIAPTGMLQANIVLPMNFAFRGAVADLSVFPDFHEVTRRFAPAAMTPFMYDGMAFALPETMSFYMLFYRRDILDDLNLDPPDTWDDIRASIAVLDHNHLRFGMPVHEQDDTFRSFGMFLMQNGGGFYSDCGRYSALNTREALDAFRDFTRFYTEYKLVQEFNFINQFRTGEMPIGIADYTVFNVLQVFAPEIHGLWGFKPVPGTLQPDGSINRTVPSAGSAVIMMEQASDKDAAWEFMKWWTSADIQTQFGNMMESVMGAAARYPTANLEAFGRMSWTARDYRNLMSQFEHVRGIPQVPGGYFTPRYIRNAFYTVVIEEAMEPRDALRNVSRLIDEEIAFKRQEFGLD